MDTEEKHKGALNMFMSTQDEWLRTSDKQAAIDNVLYKYMTDEEVMA